MAHNGGYKATLEVMHGKVELDIFQLGEHGARRFKKTRIIGEGESYIIKLK
jgi:hypothetical protein